MSSLPPQPPWPGWPDKDGLLQLPPETKPKPKRKRKPGTKAKPKPKPNPNSDLPDKALDLVEFNRAAEPRFIELTDKLIAEAGGSVPAAVIIQEAAYALNVSVETTKRYLTKYTARPAPFQLEKGLVSRRSRT